VSAAYDSCLAACSLAEPPVVWIPDSGSESTKDAPWVQLDPQWRVHPTYEFARPLPRIFNMPSKGWVYGASWDLPSRLTSRSAILEVKLTILSGTAGIMITTSDGSRALSNEKSLSSKDGEATVYFEVPPSFKSSTLILRNYGEDGVDGKVNVLSMRFAKIEYISRDYLEFPNLMLPLESR